MMFRRDLLRFLAALPLAGRLRGLWITPPGPGTDIPNAAALYRQAFEWVDGVPPEEWGGVRDALEAATLDPRADRWIERARPALEALREAAKIDECRWGDEAITLDDLDRDRLKIANRHLARVARLSARRHAEAGRFEPALDDAFAVLIYARRVGSDGPLIARLFECADEVSACATLGRILPRFDRPALDSLARRLDAFPPIAPASATIGPESRLILTTLRDRLATMGPTLEGADWERLEVNEEEVVVLKRLTGGDRDRLLGHLNSTAAAFAELGRRLDLPRAERDAAIDDFARSHRETDPFAASVAESAQGIAAAIERAGLLLAMLHAALVLVRDGETAFQALRDPFGDGPFGLERRGDGWIIRSALPGLKAEMTEFQVGDSDGR